MGCRSLDAWPAVFPSVSPLPPVRPCPRRPTTGSGPRKAPSTSVRCSAACGAGPAIRRSGWTPAAPSGGSAARPKGPPHSGSPPLGGSVRGGRLGTKKPPGSSTGCPRCSGTGTTPRASRPGTGSSPRATAARRGCGSRRTGLVLEALVPSVLEQKVTADEAYRAWRRLLTRFGEPAPGPAPQGMAVPLAARDWALVPSWEWHRAGVDNKRASTILRAVRVAARMEEAAGMPPAEARARLEKIPGIGPWTSAEVVQRTHGAPDEVTTGDLHLPRTVGWSLAGERDADDARMLELLAPYAGHRHRAVRYLLMAGSIPPRRAPKMRKTDIARW
ncbi:conserved hypothetical protein [Streptomyces sp. SPB074]|nr:conserved hypothetical protein [Streptomyces sp. SPB074]